MEAISKAKKAEKPHKIINNFCVYVPWAIAFVRKAVELVFRIFIEIIMRIKNRANRRMIIPINLRIRLFRFFSLLNWWLIRSETDWESWLTSKIPTIRPTREDILLSFEAFPLRIFSNPKVDSSVVYILYSPKRLILYIPYKIPSSLYPI